MVVLEDHEDSAVRLVALVHLLFLKFHFVEATACLLCRIRGAKVHAPCTDIPFPASSTVDAFGWAHAEAPRHHTRPKAMLAGYYAATRFIDSFKSFEDVAKEACLSPPRRLPAMTSFTESPIVLIGLLLLPTIYSISPLFELFSVRPFPTFLSEV